jgi:hypothetical protein
MFEKIINEQKTQKHRYIKGQTPPEAGISIELKNNKIVNVIESPNLKPQVRKQQYIALINNTLAEHTIKDCFVNINLTDFPQPGYFNFCRHYGRLEEFLLPNHRFTCDDIKIVNRPVDIPTFNEQRDLIRKADRPFENKISKFFVFVHIHRLEN